MAEFLARHQVDITASLPCYTRENVDSQRGRGVFDKSIEALRLLNRIGYGVNPQLPLNLVFNPQGPSLPPPQEALETDYKRRLREDFGIVFDYEHADQPVCGIPDSDLKARRLSEAVDGSLQSGNSGAGDVPGTGERGVEWKTVRLRLQPDAGDAGAGGRDHLDYRLI